MSLAREQVADAIGGLMWAAKAHATKDQRLAIADEAIEKFAHLQDREDQAYQVTMFADRRLRELAG